MDISVTIHGVQTSIAKASVTSVDYPDAYSKDFADRLAKLEASDVSGRVELARQAFNRRQYGLARQALDSALKIDPEQPGSDRSSEHHLQPDALEQEGTPALMPAAPHAAADGEWRRAAGSQ